MATPRRLVFGDVAELYDRNRPSYPPELIDDLIALAGLAEGGRALEVGAGTGKATRLFAARDISVLAIEPSPGMAAVARRNLASFSDVEVVESDFERWDPAGERFQLVYSAQAWHWIDPEVRWRRARGALDRGGVLAAFWNRPAWRPGSLREALDEVYRRVAPEIPADRALHPSTRASVDSGEWSDEVAAVEEFEAAGVRIYDYSLGYTAAEYTELLMTMSDVAILDEPRREELLSQVRAVIGEHGGVLTLPMITLACTARAV